MLCYPLAGLLDGTRVKDLAFAALNEFLCPSVKVHERAGKRLRGAHCADVWMAQGAADVLFEHRASVVIEKRDGSVIVSLADKVELAFEGHSIMARCKRAIHGVSLAAFDLPAGDERCDGTASPLGLIIKIPVMIPSEGNGSERTG